MIASFLKTSIVFFKLPLNLLTAAIKSTFYAFTIQYTKTIKTSNAVEFLPKSLIPSLIFITRAALIEGTFQRLLSPTIC